MNKILDYIKKFIKKYKILLTIIVLLLASFCIYAFVFADDDEYADKVEVTSTSINITDGTESFDSDDSAGNDSGPSNKIVRNFDSITYNISYDLGFKDETTTGSPTRNVIIDFFVPSSLSASVYEEGAGQGEAASASYTVTIDGVTYKYYQFEGNNASMVETNTVSIIIGDINSTNGTEIKPIIRVRESTDTTPSSISENGSYSSDISNTTVDSVTVSAKENYSVKLYQGTLNKNGDVSYGAVGITVYLPYDENKGIKGIQVPSSATVAVTISGGATFDIITDKDTADATGTTVEDLLDNTLASISDQNGTGTGTLTFNINFSSLSYSSSNTLDLDSDSNVDGYYLVTRKFVFQSTRGDSDKSDINIAVSTSYDSVTFLDAYEPYVGNYKSTIDFIDSANIKLTTGSSITFADHGKAVYMYNESFYIQNTIYYGDRGDTLENGFTNYIKIDSDAIKIVDVGNESDATKDYYVEFESSNESQTTSNYSVSYGVGEWTSDYFTIASDAPSYCPSSLTGLSKEELMNYYGGPCISTTDNITWVSTLDELSDDQAEDIILVKFVFNDSYYTGTRTIIRLKAETKGTSIESVVGDSYQITSRGTATWDGSTYYLSEIERYPASSWTNDITYTKTEYNDSSNLDTVGTILTEEASVSVNGEASTTTYGNTIYVVPFKAYIKDISVTDKYESEKTVVYSGITDPMEITITPVVDKSYTNSVITSATVSVYLPVTLELSIEQGDKTPTEAGQEVIDGVTYNIYNYTYDEDTIKYDGESAAGTIPTLIVHAYIAIDTPDETSAMIKSTVDASFKLSDSATISWSNALTSKDARSASTTLTLRNTKEVNSIGLINANYIEEDSSYEYTIRSANLGSTAKALEFLYILPYTGDGVGDGSSFTGTLSASIITTLPDGYTAYYTTSDAKTILSEEIASSSTVTWTTWTDYSTDVSGITAIKIVPSSAIATNGYFASKTGITFKITPSGNKEADIYYNTFYMLEKDATIYLTDDEEADEDDESYSSTTTGTNTYSANISSVSVYNRTISGKVFEDDDYDGLYTSSTDVRLSDMVVEVYKLNNDSYTSEYSKKPTEVISDSDTLVDETVTNSNGVYKFSALPAGNYYVKYKFNCDKYTTTDKNITDTSLGDLTSVDSDAEMLSITENNGDTCVAVSNIVTLNNDTVQVKNLDAGLKIRQNFDVSISKYITNVTVTSSSGTQSYDYDNETIVKIDVKNLKNTSFRVTYGFEIKNTKYFPGTIGYIIETIPDGMTFDSSLAANEGWYESDGYLYYSAFDKELIMPGETYHMTIVLDLVTDSGGDFINFVAATDLKIMQTTTSLLEEVEVDSAELVIPEIDTGGYYDDVDSTEDEYSDDDIYDDDVDYSEDEEEDEEYYDDDDEYFDDELDDGEVD